MVEGGLRVGFRVEVSGFRGAGFGDGGYLFRELFASRQLNHLSRGGEGMRGLTDTG